MKRLIILAVSATFAAAPAIAQTATSEAQTDTMAPMTADMFVMAAASSNAFEIESSQLAVDSAQDEAVRTFAEQMIEDHTAATRELSTVVAQAGLQAPELDLAAQHQEMLDQLQDAEGEEFDSLYATLQVQAHEEAIALHEAYAENGDEDALREFAEQTLPILEEHLAMAQELTAN